MIIAHSLGNPFNLKAVLAFCKKYNLWLVEDNCDALGFEYTLDVVTKDLILYGIYGGIPAKLIKNEVLGRGYLYA